MEELDMKILVTGARGFLGKNLIAELKNRGYFDIFEYDRDTGEQALEGYVKECDFVFHLAGVNRPEKTEEFMAGNLGFTSLLIKKLLKYHNKAPLVMASSIQACFENPYGRSKRAGEAVIFDYGKNNHVDLFVYRLPNVFGKWARPNYNSVIATFCYNIARNQPIQIHDPNTDMKLVYIDDVVNQFILALEGKENRNGDFCLVEPVYEQKLGDIANLLTSFRESRTTCVLPEMGDGFAKKLYATYLSYLPADRFSYPLNMNEDERGSFTEFIKANGYGQVSVNVAKPGITKGNHWHHTKNEKFLVVSGTGVIRFRHILSDEIIEYFVSGEKLEVLDIPPGYTHNIENVGTCDMVTVMWANEIFDSQHPDTYFLKV